jgi:hypothetical protein
MANITEEMKKMAIELDNTSKSIGKATGFGNVFRHQVMEVYAGTVAAGVSLQEAGAAVQALATDFSAFQPHQKATNIRMATTVALLEKVGVGGSQTAKIMDSLTRSFKMTGTEAANLTREIITAGQSAGITATKMAADFQAAFGTLAQYGSRATGVFKSMAAQAKATGIEMGSLIGMAQKFDTFEGAASSAASLNAVLGTQLSSIDLLNADYDERLNLLRDGISTTVGSFDSMDKFTQMYVAQAIGAKDVGEAQRLINMSTAEYTSYKDKMEANSKTQKELAETAEQLVPLAEKMKIAFMEFVLVFKPQIEGLIIVFQFLADNVIALTMFVGPLVAAWTFYKTVMATVAFNNALTAAGLPVLTSATAAQALATYGLGGAIMFTMAALGIFALMLWGLYAIMTETSSPAHYLLAGFMAVGVVALGLALWAIQGPAQVALLLIALLAFSMAAMFYAMAEGAGTMAEMIAELTNVEKLLEASLAIYSIAGAVGALGLAAIMSIGAVGILFAALTGIGAVIAGVGMVAGVGALGTVGDSINKIGDGLTKFATGMMTVKSAVAEIKALGGGGFIAATVEGNKTSMVVAGKDVINTVKAGEISVKVDMPDIKIPAPVINVYISGKRVADGDIRTVVDGMAGVS